MTKKKTERDAQDRISNVTEYKAMPSEKIPARDLRVGNVVYYSFYYYEITKIEECTGAYYGPGALAIHCRALEEKPFEVTFEARPEDTWTRKIPPAGYTSVAQPNNT